MPCHNIARSLTYNEQKVTLGKAELLTAANFLKEGTRLTLADKLHRFEQRMGLNDRVSTNLHITLNFDPQDILSNQQMKKIAGLYMKEIGFAHQPYLVYRHNDAGHPHCHIVTTHVRKNGDPIDLYNIGKNQSEKARQKIEAEFGLVTAELKQQQRQSQQRRQVEGVQEVIYGEGSVTRSMAAVLEYVTEKYNYTTFDELNAILRLLNVEAYRGKDNTKLYQSRGLLYRVLDENGKYIGRPLKASFFDCKPTLDNLEKKFTLNQQLAIREDCRQAVHAEVWMCKHWKRNTLEEIREALNINRIGLAMRQNKDGMCREVIYIDFVRCCAIDGNYVSALCNLQSIQQLLDEQKVRQSQRLEEDQSHTRRHRYRPSLW